jgi:hypothetical protein
MRNNQIFFRALYRKLRTLLGLEPTITAIEICSGGVSIGYELDAKTGKRTGKKSICPTAAGHPLRVEYIAEVVKDRHKYYYTAGAKMIETTKQEYKSITSYPHRRRLYYFSTALKLHYRLGLGNQLRQANQKTDQSSIQPNQG